MKILVFFTVVSCSALSATPEIMYAIKERDLSYTKEIPLLHQVLLQSIAKLAHLRDKNEYVQSIISKAQKTKKEALKHEQNTWDPAGHIIMQLSKNAEKNDN